MCSYRTCVRMVACLLIPGFELRAALRARPRLALVPAALAPEAGEEPLLGPVTAAAEAAGVKPGMRLGEALATCPSLVLVDRDPAAVEREWEGVLRRLEDAGLRRRPGRAGRRRLRDEGRRAAVRRRAAGARARARSGRLDLGSAHRRGRAPLHRPRGRERRASRSDPARRGQGGAGVPRAAAALAASDDGRPLRGARGLGLRRLGELAQLPGGAVAERLGVEGRKAWRLAQGGRKARVRGRRPASELAEALTFPEAVANELTLRRALGSLLERLLARPERAGRPFRKLALVARLVDGGSWRRPSTLRDATAEIGRLRAALGPKLAGASRARSSSFASRRSSSQSTRGSSSRSSSRPGRRLGRRLREGLRQVRASTGTGSVCAVVEVAPWSRIPEARALVVPRDD